MAASIILEASGPKGGVYRLKVGISLGWLHWLWGA